MRKLAGQTVIYGVGAAGGKLLGLLLVPIYTRALAPAEYGAMALLAVVASMLLLLGSTGITTALLKFYYRYPEPARDRVLATNATLAVLIFTLPCTLGLAAAAGPLSRLLVGPGARPEWLLLVAAANLLEALLLVPTTLLRARERAGAYAALSGGRLVLNLGLNVALVVVLGLGVTGVVAGNAATVALLHLTAGVPLLYCLLSLGSVDGALLRELVRYGLPLVPGQAALWALNFSDRFFLQHYASLNQVGLYSLGYAFGFAVAVVALFPFQTAWSPFMFSLAERPEGDRILAGAATYFLALTAFLVLAVSVLGGDVVRLLAPRSYWQASRVIPLVALAYGLLGLALVLCSGILLTRRTEAAGTIYGLGGVINLGLNALLIPPFQQMGAAWATLLSAAVLPLPMYLWARRLHPLPYEWGRLGRLAAGGLACYAAAQYLPGGGGGPWLRLALVASFPVLLYGAGFYHKAELSAARLAWRRHQAALTGGEPCPR